MNSFLNNLVDGLAGYDSSMMFWRKCDMQVTWSDVSSIVTSINNHFCCIFCQLKQRKDKVKSQSECIYVITVFSLIIQNKMWYLFSIAPPIDCSSWSAAPRFTNQRSILAGFWCIRQNRYLDIGRRKSYVKLPGCFIGRAIAILNRNVGGLTSQFLPIMSLLGDECKLSRGIVVPCCVDGRELTLTNVPTQGC